MLKPTGKCLECNKCHHKCSIMRCIHFSCTSLVFSRKLTLFYVLISLWYCCFFFRFAIGCTSYNQIRIAFRMNRSNAVHNSVESINRTETKKNSLIFSGVIFCHDAHINWVFFFFLLKLYFEPYACFQTLGALWTFRTFISSLRTCGYNVSLLAHVCIRAHVRSSFSFRHFCHLLLCSVQNKPNSYSSNK